MNREAFKTNLGALLCPSENGAPEWWNGSQSRAPVAQPEADGKPADMARISQHETSQAGQSRRPSG